MALLSIDAGRWFCISSKFEPVFEGVAGSEYDV